MKPPSRRAAACGFQTWYLLLPRGDRRPQPEAASIGESIFDCLIFFSGDSGIRRPRPSVSSVRVSGTRGRRPGQAVAGRADRLGLSSRSGPCGRLRVPRLWVAETRRRPRPAAFRPPTPVICRCVATDYVTCPARELDVLRTPTTPRRDRVLRLRHQLVVSGAHTTATNDLADRALIAALPTPTPPDAPVLLVHRLASSRCHRHSSPAAGHDAARLVGRHPQRPAPCRPLATEPHMRTDASRRTVGLGYPIGASTVWTILPPGSTPHPANRTAWTESCARSARHLPAPFPPRPIALRRCYAFFVIDRHPLVHILVSPLPDGAWLTRSPQPAQGLGDTAAALRSSSETRRQSRNLRRLHRHHVRIIKTPFKRRVPRDRLNASRSLRRNSRRAPDRQPAHSAAVLTSTSPLHDHLRTAHSAKPLPTTTPPPTNSNHRFRRRDRLDGCSTIPASRMT